MIIIATLLTDLVSSISDLKKNIWNLVPNWTDNSQKKVSLFIFDFHYVFNEPKNIWIQDSRNKYTNLGHSNDNDKRR